MLVILHGLSFNGNMGSSGFSTTTQNKQRRARHQSQIHLNSSMVAVEREEEAATETEKVILGDLLLCGNLNRAEVHTGIFGLVERTLEIFSLQENLPAIFSMKREPGTSSCIDGIRVLSLLSQMLVHTSQITGEYSVDNSSYFWKSMKHPLFFFLGAGPYFLSVDCFFLISGMLSTRSLLNGMKNSDNKMAFKVTLKYIYNRIIRLQPLHLYVVSMTTVLFSLAPRKLMSTKLISLKDDCKTNWWANALLMQDRVHVLKICLPWTWYLANDFQFYIITPLLMFLYIKAKRLMFATVGLLFLLLFAETGKLSYFLHLPIRYRRTDSSILVRYLNNYYIKTHCRYGPFLLGLVLGIIMFKRKEIVIKNKMQVLLGWVSSLCVMFLVITLPFALGDSYSSHSIALATYQASHRIMWAAAIAWIIFACEQGYGGILNKMLSWDIWNFLSKISYAAYLLHPSIILIYTGLQDTSLHYSAINIIYMFFGHCVTTFLTALALTVLVERPFQKALRL